MKSPSRILVLIALAATVTACTHDGGSGGGGRSSTGASPGASPTFVAPPGTSLYVYSNAGLVATMELRGDRGTLKIQNQTGRELPAPGFYLLAATDGHRVPGTVSGAAPVPSGATESFPVSFEGLRDQDIGLVILLMGHDNYGAFVRH
ncbi:MAG TPA: hypothetical protein VFC04_00600 [Actinomycetota bacterium]|nr:hypothetical protein [Actinomycetota bacterium]